MKRIYSAPLLAIVENMKNVLQLHGIESTVTNQYLSAGVGELPPIESWPQLWVAEQDAERAEEIIQEAEATPSELQNPWICPKCHEEIEGQFTECWNCGAARNPEEK